MRKTHLFTVVIIGFTHSTDLESKYYKNSDNNNRYKSARRGSSKSNYAIIQSGDTLYNIAQEYHTSVRDLIDTNNIEPPYILVCHSLGGLYVRGFAHYYPDLLAGLIIIDPADFTETHQNKKLYYEDTGWESHRVDSLIQSFIDRRNQRHAQSPPAIRREGQYLEEIRDR